MDRRVRTDPFLSEQDDHDLTSEDYLPESPSAASPPKKSRRGVKKRVVSVPIGDVEGSKGKGEAYPPSDSWAWRKYGQKPIKGSPYPRGYYRCSSSKGCPARKQVERSRVDPTMLVITYAFDHNHQLPATKSHHHSSAAISAVDSPPRSSTPSSSTSSADQNNTSLSPAKPQQPDDTTVFTPELELGGDSHFKSFLGDFGWLADLAAYDRIIDGPIYGGNEMFDDVDNLMVLSGRGDDEDESLFADLEELPEGSVIFGRRAVRSDEPNRTCSNSVLNY